MRHDQNATGPTERASVHCLCALLFSGCFRAIFYPFLLYRFLLFRSRTEQNGNVSKTYMYTVPGNGAVCPSEFSIDLQTDICQGRGISLLQSTGYHTLRTYTNLIVTCTLHLRCVSYSGLSIIRKQPALLQNHRSLPISAL